MDDRRPVDEQAFIELTLVTVELLGALAAIVKRLEAIPGAPPMDGTRATMAHVKDRLHDLLTPYLGEQKRIYFPDFDLPDAPPPADDPNRGDT
jgi:hypothetical protein